MQSAQATQIDHHTGVLLVHGIGSQTQGSTLSRWANALISTIAQENAVDVVTTSLSGHTDGEPSHSSVHVHLDQTNPHKLLIAEATWAEVFTPPSKWELLYWSIKSIPWTVVLHMDEAFRRRGIAFAEAKGTGAIVALASILLEMIWLFLGLLLAPIILLLIIVLIILSILPWRALQEFTESVLRGLSGTLGDSLVFTDNKVINAAICSKVTADLTWLRQRCDRVVVLAHSQGAAVAHTVLRRSDTISVDRLVTFGSGLRKLLEVKSVTDLSVQKSDNTTQEDKIRKSRWANAWAWLCLLATAAAASTMLYAWLTSVWFVPSDANSTAHFVLSAIVAPFVLAASSLAVRQLIARFLNPWLNQPTPDKHTTQSYLLPCLLNLGGLVILGLVAFWLAFSEICPHIKIHSAAIATLMGASFTLMVAWRYSTRRGSTKEHRITTEKGLWCQQLGLTNVTRWDDIYASQDPVSHGPVLEYLDDLTITGIQLRTYQISNRESLVSDHTSYWNNESQFLRPIAHIVLDNSGKEAASPVSSASLPVWMTFGFRLLSLLAIVGIPLTILWYELDPAVTLGYLVEGDIERQLSAAWQAGLTSWLVLMAKWLSGYVLAGFVIAALVAALGRWRAFLTRQQA